MPSFSNLVFAVGSAQAVLGSLTSPVHRGRTLAASSEVCHDTQLSCHNTTAVSNLCCFEAPGGLILQTQFWDTNPSAGPSNSWTIHGLWPDNCDGTYQQYCDENRQYTNITQILQANGDTALLAYMKKYWASNAGTEESFWEHEWGKHGTCMSTFDPKCYTNYEPGDEVPQFFNRTVNIFKSLPSYNWLSAAGIVPSNTKTYTLAQIQNALKTHHGGHVPYVGCANTNQLDELWYYFYVNGPVQTGKLVPTDQTGTSSCPATGIKYLPKSGSTAPTSSTTGPTSTKTHTTSKTSTKTTSTKTSPTSTPTGTFSGKGYLNVITSGSQDGCIISYGTWYIGGTCATYTASASGDGFTLTSSKGNCAVQSGALTCSSSVNTPTVFNADGKDLSYNGASTFYADEVPSGDTQATVYTADSHSVSFKIEWQSI